MAQGNALHWKQLRAFLFLKHFMCVFVAISITTNVFAFGGGGGGSGRKATEYKGGVESIGVHFGGTRVACTEHSEEVNGLCVCIDGYTPDSEGNCIIDLCANFSGNSCVLDCDPATGELTYAAEDTPCGTGKVCDGSGHCGCISGLLDEGNACYPNACSNFVETDCITGCISHGGIAEYSYSRAEGHSCNNNTGRCHNGVCEDIVCNTCEDLVNGVCVARTCGTNETCNAQQDQCVCLDKYVRNGQGVCTDLCANYQDQTECNPTCDWKTGNPVPGNEGDYCADMTGRCVSGVCTPITCDVCEELVDGECVSRICGTNQTCDIEQDQCVCLEGYVHVDGVCTDLCANYQDQTECNPTCDWETGYGIPGNEGEYCADKTGRCVDGLCEPIVCDVCEDLVDGECVSRICGTNQTCDINQNECVCASGYVEDQGVCVDQCTVATTAEQCALCEGYSYYNGVCYPACEEGYWREADEQSCVLCTIKDGKSPTDGNQCGRCSGIRFTGNNNSQTGPKCFYCGSDVVDIDMKKGPYAIPASCDACTNRYYSNGKCSCNESSRYTKNGSTKCCPLGQIANADKNGCIPGCAGFTPTTCTPECTPGENGAHVYGYAPINTVCGENATCDGAGNCICADPSYHFEDDACYPDACANFEASDCVIGCTSVHGEAIYEYAPFNTSCGASAICDGEGLCLDTCPENHTTYCASKENGECTSIGCCASTLILNETIADECKTCAEGTPYCYIRDENGNCTKDFCCPGEVKPNIGINGADVCYENDDDYEGDCRSYADCESGYYCKISTASITGSCAYQASGTCTKIEEKEFQINLAGMITDFSYSTEDMSWFAAKDFCEAQGMRMLELDDLGCYSYDEQSGTSTPITGRNLAENTLCCADGVNCTSQGTCWAWNNTIGRNYFKEECRGNYGSGYETLSAYTGNSTFWINANYGSPNSCHSAYLRSSVEKLQGDSRKNIRTAACIKQTSSSAVSCSTNEDCALGQYCNITTESPNCSAEKSGICAPIEYTEKNVDFGCQTAPVRKSIQTMTAWAADNWCKAQGMEMLTLDALNCYPDGAYPALTDNSNRSAYCCSYDHTCSDWSEYWDGDIIDSNGVNYSPAAIGLREAFGSDSLWTKTSYISGNCLNYKVKLSSGLANANVQYATDVRAACAPEINCSNPSVISCTTNEECGVGKYCHLNGSVNNCTPTETGVCMTPSSFGYTDTTLSDGTLIRKAKRTMNYWNAQSWCQTQGMEMIEATDFNCYLSGTNTLILDEPSTSNAPCCIGNEQTCSTWGNYWNGATIKDEYQELVNSSYSPAFIELRQALDSTDMWTRTPNPWSCSFYTALLSHGTLGVGTKSASRTPVCKSTGN